MEKTRELGEANIGRLMLKFFIPAFIGVFVNALYNIVDRIFIGQGVGADALSGISVIFPIMLIIMALGMLIGIGTGVIVSINLGKKDIVKAEKVLGTGFLLMIVVSVIATIITYSFKEPILRSFGATDEIIGYANDYLNIILAGIIFQVVGFSLNNVIRSEGNARIAMLSMVLSAGLNMVLDPIFIFGFGMGVKGAAWATLISMMALAVWVLFHFLGNRSVVKMHRKYIVYDRQIMFEILGIGMAPFAMQIANSLVQGLINKKLIFYGGDLAVGAMGILNSIATLIIMSIVALNMASQPIIGYNFGANSVSRVKSALRLGMISATIISIAAFTLIQSLPEYMIKLFNTNDPELFAIAVPGLRLALIGLPVIGFQVVASNFFQSVGKAKIAMFLTLLRQVLFLIPLLYILPLSYGLTGIWISLPIADSLSALVVTYFTIREWKKLTVQELA